MCNLCNTKRDSSIIYELMGNWCNYICNKYSVTTVFHLAKNVHPLVYTDLFETSNFANVNHAKIFPKTNQYA